MAKRKYDDDDGRTIVNMNVDGMPWYRPPRAAGENPADQPKLSKRETRSVVLGALAAALLVCGVFALGYFLFILFCDKIWFQ